MGIYKNTVSPIQDLYDRVIVSSLPKDFAPVKIKEMADDYKEKVHGINSQIEELITWQDIKNEREKDEYERPRKTNKDSLIDREK